VFSQTFASLESLARELEEGATGLLDPSPLSAWQRQAATRGGSRAAAARPLPFDAVEQGDSVLLLFDVPGVKRENVQVSVAAAARRLVAWQLRWRLRMCGVGIGGACWCPQHALLSSSPFNMGLQCVIAAD
jgi:hypothetical protein